MPEQFLPKMQRPAEDKAVKPAEDKPAAPRWTWEAISSDGRQAEHGHWRVRVQMLGGSGGFRPFVEYVGEDFPTERAAERALERLLR